MPACNIGLASLDVESSLVEGLACIGRFLRRGLCGRFRFHFHRYKAMNIGLASLVVECLLVEGVALDGVFVEALVTDFSCSSVILQASSLRACLLSIKKSMKFLFASLCSHFGSALWQRTRCWSRVCRSRAGRFRHGTANEVRWLWWRLQCSTCSGIPLPAAAWAALVALRLARMALLASR